MMKRICVAVCIGATISMFGCAGCDRASDKALDANVEFRQIKASLHESQQQKTQLESDVQKLDGARAQAETQLAEETKAKQGLQVQVQELTVSRANLETRVNDLTKSRDDLQKMVESLMDTRGVLEKQVAGLTQARNAALEDARVAQSKVNVLNDNLKAQTQQMIDLQDQIKTIRSVLEQMQQKLE